MPGGPPCSVAYCYRQLEHEVSQSTQSERRPLRRPWATVFELLPSLRGQLVLDLGCGEGSQAAELVARGARVIGIDLNEEVLQRARSRRLPDAELRLADLRALPDLGVTAQVLWSRFSAAYFPDLPAVLAAWSRHLEPGGRVVLTEIDDLFGHQPLAAGTKAVFDAYARDALAAGRYDFHMGRKLRRHLERSGFTVAEELAIEDPELSFDGPARPEVVEAWQARFDRMTLLRDFCGPDFEEVREELLGCLARPDHRSTATIYCCIATRKGPPA